jgi:hypothetical protein
MQWTTSPRSRTIWTRDTTNHSLCNASQRLSGAVGEGGAEDEEQEGAGRLGRFKGRFGQKVGVGEWTEFQEGIEAEVELPLSKNLPRRWHECVGASSLLDPFQGYVRPGIIENPILLAFCDFSHRTPLQLASLL